MDTAQKSLQTVFSIVICLQSGDKRQSKTLFLTIFLVYDNINVFDCRLSGMFIDIQTIWNKD